MKSQAAHQLSLPLSGEAAPRLVRTTRAANKKRGKRIATLHLKLKEKRFLPVVGVPRTRADCPSTKDSFCAFVRCRFNLALLEADHRAGRPGLGKVPRNQRGLTISTPGDMGEERAGTTVNPRWLELDRRCHVWCERDEHGQFVTLHATHENEWEHFRERLHMGEAIDVLVDGTRVGGARMTPDGLALDHQPAWFSAVLQRVRGVPSCALDEIERLGKMSNEQAGDALARHRTLVARELRGAMRKAIEEAEARGMEAHDLMGALMQMGASR